MSNVIRGCVIEDSAAWLMARVVAFTGAQTVGLMQQASVTSITRYMYDIDNSDVPLVSTTGETLTKTEVVYDTAVTTNPFWPHSDGYNFLDEIDFATIGLTDTNRIQVEYVWNPVTGANFVVGPFVLDVTNVKYG